MRYGNMSARTRIVGQPEQSQRIETTKKIRSGGLTGYARTILDYVGLHCVRWNMGTRLRSLHLLVDNIHERELE